MPKELLADALELDIAQRIELTLYRQNPSDSISWEELKAEIGR